MRENDLNEGKYITSFQHIQMGVMLNLPLGKNIWRVGWCFRMRGNMFVINMDDLDYLISNLSMRQHEHLLVEPPSTYLQRIQSHKLFSQTYSELLSMVGCDFFSGSSMCNIIWW